MSKFSSTKKERRIKIGDLYVNVDLLIECLAGKLSPANMEIARKLLRAVSHLALEK